MSAYIVGGMVRDIILKRPSTDLDITVEGDAVKVAGDYARAVGGMVKSVTKFGTCKVHGGPAGVVDFAATRTETYSRPGALPDVRPCPNIVRDLERRDFAVNAMAMSLSRKCCGVVLDPFDGWGDIKRKQLAVLHPESFSDDPTRILRGIRLAARYGYHFEKHTLGFLKQCVSGDCMLTISGKRVRRELQLIFAENEVVRGIRLLERYGVLRDIADVLGFGKEKVRRLTAVDRARQRIQEWAGGDDFDPGAFWFAYLCTGQKRSAVTRLAGYLNLDRRMKRACIWAACDLTGTVKRLSGLKPPIACEATGVLENLPVEWLALLYAASGKKGRGMIESFLKRWRHVKPILSGADLVALGIDPGPEVGEMLDRILSLKLEGKLPNRRSEAAFVKREAGVRS
jgi:tRNA nucleotidyltransferase (CCA-adding enzyme)